MKIVKAVLAISIIRDSSSSNNPFLETEAKIEIFKSILKAAKKLDQDRSLIKRFGKSITGMT